MPKLVLTIMLLKSDNISKTTWSIINHFNIKSEEVSKNSTLTKNDLNNISTSVIDDLIPIISTTSNYGTELIKVSLRDFVFRRPTNEKEMFVGNSFIKKLKKYGTIQH